MSKNRWYLIVSLTSIAWCGLMVTATRSQAHLYSAAIASQKVVYTPILLPLSGETRDTLSERDIPNGDGGFARDYLVKLNAGDRIAIDVFSDAFDPVVIFLSTDGKTLGKNDDAPDGSSNSLLFMRIKTTGNYIIRVQGFGETSSGDFTLKVSKLKEL